MSEFARGGLGLDDEDRLPWLEPAIDEDEGRGVSPLRLLGLVLLGLLLVGAVVGGVWLIQNRGVGTAGGEGELIAAPAEPYKLAANEADAKKFDGEGDASFAASEGVARDGRIDPSRVPEAPIAKTAPSPNPPAGPARPAQSLAAKVTDETRVRGATSQVASTGVAMIQLGAYGSEAVARDGWKKLSKRYAYLAPLAMTIEPAQVGGGTVYRLRAAAGAQARTICGKLKVAGESCLVVG